MCNWTKLALLLFVLFLIWNTFLKKDECSEYHKFITQELGTDIDRFSQRSEAFSPNYEKELALFKSMNFEQQQAYLNLSKAEKKATYGSKLK